MALYDRDTYVSRLRRTFIHSADVMPNDVKNYLLKTAQDKVGDIWHQIVDEYTPLVNALPNEFVDFVIDVLKIRTKQKRLSDGTVFEYAEDDEDEDDHIMFSGMEGIFRKYGIEDDFVFFPPAYFQRPFLYLLKNNEQEGLRLVHGLANIAVEKWRQYQQYPTLSGYGGTPLPVDIHLSSGTRSFWGDQNVYMWFRTSGSGPASVMSALMALEFWMERQLEADRNAEELFETVLSGCDCIAVAGICLSLSLEFQETCLKAALPLVSSPALWTMDISRAAMDQMKPWDFSPWGFKEHIFKLRAERDQQQHRRRDVRQLAMFYMLHGNSELKKLFQEALERFTTDLPFSYKEQRNNFKVMASLAQLMEECQIYADIANYHAQPDGSHVIWVVPPPHIQARNKPEMERINQKSMCLRLGLWAQKSIEAGKIADDLTPSEAVVLAKELQKPDDFSVLYGLDESLSMYRLDAIAGVAATILAISFEWAHEQTLIAWSTDILMKAAALPDKSSAESRDSTLISDPRMSAGYGLGTLVAKGIATQDVKNQIYQLVSHYYVQIVEATFKGLKQSWNFDAVFCWNALSLGLSLSLVPRNDKTGIIFRGYAQQQFVERSKWIKGLVDEHSNKTTNNIISELPVVLESNQVSFHWHVAIKVLSAIPLNQLVANAYMKQQILRLTDSLMLWTLHVNQPQKGRHNSGFSAPFDWNMFFRSWLAELTLYISLEEAQQHVLGPVSDNWSILPEMTKTLMLFYIDRHLGKETIASNSEAQWQEMCNWILDSPDMVTQADRKHLDNELYYAISQVLFVGHGRPLFKEEWPHIQRFRGIIEKCVDVIGHQFDLYADLLVMLRGIGKSFLPEPALHWLDTTTGKVSDLEAFWAKHSNGVETAHLLKRMWDEHETYIRSNKDSLHRYSRLVDLLVAAGVPLASQLQQQLEKRN